MSLDVDHRPAVVPVGHGLRCRVADGCLVLERGGRVVTLHPLWVRERSVAGGAVDPANLQRLTEPLDMPLDLGVQSAEPVRLGAAGGVVDGVGAGVEVGVGVGVTVLFTDGHRMELGPDGVEAAFGRPDRDQPPAAEPWIGADFAVAVIDYEALTGAATADATMLYTLDRFYRDGCFVLRGTPAVSGALYKIASHFGPISPTNFGTLFDVRTEPAPTDLAYTSVALTAHTDQPYRRPVPSLQFLHTIVNDAPGGSSTIVDGLAAVQQLALADPEAHRVLSTLPVEFRYDIGTDVKIARMPMIDLHGDGSLRQIRYSPRLDFAPVADRATLDIYYRGRRRLAEYLNHPDNRAEFRMDAGDVLVVDNHRILHGRSAFDPTRGRRHLQGCYIDHDGPETEWRLARRRQRHRESR